MKVYISPFFRGEDRGDGGIRRVVEAQVKYLPQFGIDIVEDPMQADVLGIHASADIDINKPRVAHCHGLYWKEYYWGHWAHKVNEEVIKVMNRAVKVTAPSEWVANSIRRGMAIDAIPVYHGIDVNEWEPGKDGGYILWNKTRVDAVCDPKIVDDLAIRFPELHFISTFGNAVSRPNVKLTGVLPFKDAKKYIQNASMYLCTTRETFGIGTLEAMICGVPIVGWNWGGQSEFIENGIHGWLAQPGDINELAKGIEYVLKYRAELSKNCIETVKSKFTWEIAAKKYAEIYKAAYEEEFTSVKVSIVIPTYNLANLLPEAVQSVTEQRFSDYEIVIVDDKSTDESGEIADIIAEDNPKVRVIHNQANQYLSGALNIGIEAARGKYIIPLDADNMLGENTLNVLSSYLDTHPDSHVAYGAMKVIEPDGKEFISGWPGEFDLRQQLIHRNQCPSTSMYRKRMWKRVGGYRRRCRTAEDADFWCRVGSFGGNPKKVTGAVTLIYRNREDSMSHVQRDWPWNQWYTWYKNLDLMPYATSVYGYKPQVESYEPAKITVIIPCGPGHTKYLADAIDSVVGQTYVNWNIIVVNDSGDSLPTTYPFVKVINTTKAGSGVAQARNLGIAASKTPLFLLLDADDYLQSNALELMYQTYINNVNEYKLYVYCDWIEQETGKIYNCPEYNCERVLHKLEHSVVCLYSKESWEKVGHIDEELDVWEDWDFIIALNAAGYCGVRVPAPLFQYRMQSGTRREYLYSIREKAKEYIYNKWKDFITGSKNLMACGGCGRRAAVNKNPAPVNKSLVNMNTAPALNTAVLLEFTKEGAGTTTFKGKNNSYRFGSDIAHRIKYVAAEDVAKLLSLGFFREVIGVQTDVLEAQGPPNK